MSGTSSGERTQAGGSWSTGEKGRRCAICGRPTDPRHAPFCSRRCRLIDLKRWFGEEYRLPADESERRLVDERGDGEGGE